MLLALSGVIGLWGVGFWTFELVANVLRPLGYSTEEIRERLGRASRSVRRLRERVRGQLERLRAEASF